MSVTNREANLSLALIGNCAVNALVDAQARVVWCCLPRPDSDPVFHALLDSGQGISLDGTMAVELEGLDAFDQSYVPGTAILRPATEVVTACFVRPNWCAASDPFRVIHVCALSCGHVRIGDVLSPT